MKVIVTTTQTTGETESLHRFVSDSGFTYVPRNRMGIGKLGQIHEADAVIVWEAGGPVLYMEDERFFFHPSMAKNRIGLYRKSGTLDLMIRACQIQKGDRVLDCTLGLGADAIVSSYFSQNEVTGLESIAPVAYVIKWGMQMYASGMPWLDEAIHRIKAEHQDHGKYLKNCRDGSFDVVYFDPMFQQPLMKSQAIHSLRQLADHRLLTNDTIKEARRVARKRVVLKDRFDSTEFERLGFDQMIGNSNHLIAYGVMNIK